ncbi:hypothetical protein MGYG_07494 [Nannizzia gypsea CBS 118893]|uniref:Secreted protein n=1 Tax=Arthroderma gypseum (strain ATCC MYA-4604 / CBS 118893) TaxID=535722 RepID=E4V3B2_ARTGP|nr:hypothetical protein MGYG_07494 [Nannizzia gypsea CBS 118893]EFR04486.1 hypothetical protein MGYG_07494 [Nannizzia gypsea CBS 118893]
MFPFSLVLSLWRSILSLVATGESGPPTRDNGRNVKWLDHEHGIMSSSALDPPKEIPDCYSCPFCEFHGRDE